MLLVQEQVWLTCNVIGSQKWAFAFSFFGGGAIQCWGCLMFKPLRTLKSVLVGVTCSLYLFPDCNLSMCLCVACGLVQWYEWHWQSIWWVCFVLDDTVQFLQTNTDSGNCRSEPHCYIQHVPADSFNEHLGIPTQSKLPVKISSFCLASDWVLA